VSLLFLTDRSTTRPGPVIRCLTLAFAISDAPGLTVQMGRHVAAFLDPLLAGLVGRVLLFVPPVADEQSRDSQDADDRHRQAGKTSSGEGCGLDDRRTNRKDDVLITSLRRLGALPGPRRAEPGSAGS